MNEATSLQIVRLEAAELDIKLWRNNVGAVHTADGRFIRYGLANESHAMNQQIKSSDLIGIRRVIITPAHVGRTFGQFVAREVKKPTWVYKGTKREEAQKRYLEMVLDYGGDAAFCTGRGTL